MSVNPQLSPRRSRRLRPKEVNNAENIDPARNHGDIPWNAQTEQDAMNVSKMKTLFEQAPRARLVPEMRETDLTKQDMFNQSGLARGDVGSLSAVKNRLMENVLLGGEDGTEERKISPSLRQLMMTPGRALQKQKILERKHHEAKSRVHNLGVGGGISLWPQMENMRLNRQEVTSLAALSLTLVAGVTALFHYLHGGALTSLKFFNKELLKFPLVRKIDYSSREHLGKSVLAWHLAFTNLMDSIHQEFDTQWPKTLGTYHFCAAVYIICIGLLLYYLVNNMFTKSRLTPQRIKIWVCLLVVTGVWSILMVYLLSRAQRLETEVETNVHILGSYLSDLVFLDLNLDRYNNVLLYWRTRCLPPTTTGTLSIMGLLQVRDVSYYLQYYSLPILTALLTPVVRLVLALKEVYSANLTK